MTIAATIDPTNLDATRPLALVTGGASGIGLAIVEDLARDREVIALGRSEEKLRTLLGRPHIHPVALELRDGEALARFAAPFTRLDVLVHSAAISVLASLETSSLPAWRDTFETNVFGLVAVTQAFLPLLHASTSARIVNVSSILGSQALHADPASPIYDFKVPAYNASKAAVNNWTLSLAYELRATPIKVNTVHPGYVRTDMNAGEGEIDVADGARSSVQMALLDADGPSGSFTHLGQVLPW